MLDLFASPGTLVPIVAGISSLMFSWAIGGDATANAIGIVGMLGGAGHFASRLVLGLEGITQRAYEAIHQRDEKKRNDALDALASQLKQDKDRRTETCLSHLRHLYAEFKKSCQTNHLDTKHPRLVSQVDDIFNASVAQLERSWQLYQVSRKVAGRSRETYLAEREKVIQEVIETRNHLNSTIEQFHAFALRKGDTDLSRLRQELDETLHVAKRTQERMANLTQPRPDQDRQSEFQ